VLLVEYQKLTMKITRLILKNVRCYEHLDMSFLDFDKNEQEIGRARTIILGNNGTGKSTILRSIALLLSGSSALGELIGNPDKWIKHGENSCNIKATFNAANGEKRHIELMFKKGDELSQIIDRNRESLSQLESSFEYTNRNYLTIGYGVHRRIGESHQLFRNENFRANNVSSLFLPNSALYPFESWVLDLDYRRGSEGLMMIEKAINKLLPGITFYKIHKEKRAVLFKSEDGILSFDELSDGYQISANWLGDLLFRITNIYEDRKDPFKARFILLIDEIALHLHPSWQRKIIDSISELFPNAQLIASTHSPFVAQQARDNELFTVIKDEKSKSISLFHFESDPRQLLIHQILMSDIFGLETDESVLIQGQKNSLRSKRKEKLAEFKKRLEVKDFTKSKSKQLSSAKVKGNLRIPLDNNEEERIALLKKLTKELENLKNDSIN